MRVWLDDKRPMPDGFNTHARTADEAIALLSSGRVVAISFDHDLGTKKTGYDVAAWIEKAVFDGKVKLPEWDIHSANPVGATNILIAMRSAERFVQRREQAAQ